MKLLEFKFTFFNGILAWFGCHRFFPLSYLVSDNISNSNTIGAFNFHYYYFFFIKERIGDEAFEGINFSELNGSTNSISSSYLVNRSYL